MTDDTAFVQLNRREVVKALATTSALAGGITTGAIVSEEVSAATTVSTDFSEY